MRTTDPSSRLTAAKHARMERNRRMRAPHTAEEKEEARQARLNRHLGDIMSAVSTIADPSDDLHVRQI